MAKTRNDYIGHDEFFDLLEKYEELLDFVEARLGSSDEDFLRFRQKYTELIADLKDSTDNYQRGTLKNGR